MPFIDVFVLPVSRSRPVELLLLNDALLIGLPSRPDNPTCSLRLLHELRLAEIRVE
jgi:hypothetical protein